MSAGILNLVIEQGATFRRVLTWSIAGVAVNLTGYTARMQVRADYDAAPILSLTSDPGGGITLGGSAGTITVLASASLTAALTPGAYLYDLELESADGTVTRLLKGQATVDPEVTK